MPGSLLLLRAALILGLLAAAAFGFWETRRWSAPESRDIISPRQRVLRGWGLFFLLATLGLFLGWTYLTPPSSRQAMIGYAQYVLLIWLAALPLAPLALLDWRENLRNLAQSRKKLFDETLGPLAQEIGDPPPNPPA